MQKAIGIESKWYIIFNYNLDNFISIFYNWYASYKLYNTKTNEFITTNENEVWDYIDKNVINTTPFWVYEINKEKNTVKKIQKVEWTELPFCLWIKSTIWVLGTNYWINELYKSWFLNSKDSINNQFNSDYRNSRSKKSVELTSKIKQIIEKNEYMNIDDLIIDNGIYLFEEIIENYKVKYKINLYTSKLNLEIFTKKNDKNYEILNGININEFNNHIDTKSDIKELFEKINEKFVENKEMILIKLNKIFTNRKSCINTLLSDLLNDELFIKEKKIINKVTEIKEKLDSIDINTLVEQENGNLFDLIKKEIEKKYYEINTQEVSFLDKVDSMKDFSTKDIFKLLNDKQKHIIVDYNQYIFKIEIWDLLKWNIKTIWSIKENELVYNIWDSLSEIINNDILELENETTINNYKSLISNKNSDNDLKFNTLKLENLEEISDYNTQNERSKAFAESIQVINEIENLYKNISSYNLNSENIQDFKEKVLVYKELSNELLKKYSWGWWLLMNRKIITAILKYTSLNSNISENEEFFYKELLYTNTWNLLNYILEKFTEDKDTEKTKIITGNIEILKKFDLYSESIYKLSLLLNNIFDWLEKNKITENDLEWFKITNESWKWSYYTPNKFWNFLLPFTNNTSFLYQVSVLDTSCWKGNLLNYLQWDNIKKIWNDINPLSLKVINYTQGFDYDSILKSNNIHDINRILSNSKLITTNQSSLAYLNYNIEVDFLLTNPPYINTEIWNKETENILKENKIKNISNWKVNMVEFTYKWLINKLKLWWIWMLISSARWLSKTEQKVRLDSDNYLVPLYRIWVSWKPFKKEWVLLANISISWDDVYVYDKWEFRKDEDNAEFFVTIYTRLNKKYQEYFWNTAPTILMNYNDIAEFNKFVVENIDNINIFSNYKNYLNVSRKIKIDEINKYFKEKNLLTSLDNDDEYLNEDDFREKIKNIDNIWNFIEYKNSESKSVNKIKYLKPTSITKQKIDDLLDQFRKIDERLIPLAKESLKWYINDNSMKLTLKKEFWLEYNWYSFNIRKDSKIKKIWSKYMFYDKDCSNILNFPYPYSLHTLPLNTYSELISKYLLSFSVTESYINQKISSFNQVFKQFSDYNKEESIKVIENIWNLNIKDPLRLSKYLIKWKDFLLKSDNQWIWKIVNNILEIEKSWNKENIENFIYYLRQNPYSFEANITNHEKFNYTIKKFIKWYKLKLKDNSLFNQSEKSVSAIISLIKKYSYEKKINVFDEILNWNYKNSINLLNNLWKILINEFNNWNNYFDLIDPFKNHKSELIKDFSWIVSYTNFKKIQKIDKFFDEVAHIDELSNNINSEIDYVFNNSKKDIKLKFFIDTMIKHYDDNNITSLTNEKLLEYIKNALLLSKSLDPERIKNIENNIAKLENDIRWIRNEKIKDLYNLNCNALKNNLEWIKSIYSNIINLNTDKCNHSYYYINKKIPIDLVKDVRIILWIDKENDFEICKLNYKPIKNLFYNNINNNEEIELFKSSNENPLKKILKNKIDIKKEIRKKTKNIKQTYFTYSLDNELKKDFESNNMLLDIYKEDVSENFKNNYKEKVKYIDEIISYYKIEELKLQNENTNQEEKNEINKFLNYAKFLTINTNEYEKIILLDYVKNYWIDTSNIDLYVEKNIDKFYNVSKDNIKNHIIIKNNDFELYWREMADSIVMSLWVKSNYSNLYSNIFLDLESELLLNNNKEQIFKPDFIKFQNYLEDVSPYQEVIKLSNRYAELLNQKSILRKKDPLLKDLLEIETISDYVDINEFNELSEEDLFELIKSNIELKKQTNKSITTEIDNIELKLSNKDELIAENRSKLLPTFVQSKALYKFNEALNNNTWLIKLLNQSEVWTWKTFTMPFYESLLDNKYKNELNSFKLYITEANLVSNTTKSLIENWKMPSDILEWKISNLDEIKKIINFIKNGWTNLILSNASLYNFDTLNIRILSKFLSKYVWNIYFYSDEATFLKNTESNSYSWYKILLAELKKTNKLRLQNYLTATPVNNDNWDFLYLLELFNKRDILKYIKNINISKEGRLELYNLMTKTDNLKLWQKEIKFVEDNKEIYYYIPNIIYLLEFIRTWYESSLSRIDLNNTIEIDDKNDSSKKAYITVKKYYEEFGISIKEISYEEYKNPDYIFDNPLCFNSKTETLAFELINLFKNLTIINFDRNLNSIWLKWNTSKLFKTYYSLTPSLIESLIIENFLKEIWKIQKFKKISNAIWTVRKNRLFSIENIFELEWKHIFNNLILEVWDIIGIEMNKSSYSVQRKIKKWYKEVEENKSYNYFEVDKEKLMDWFNTDDWDDFIFSNKFIDNLLMNIDIISYSNYKNKVKEINNLKEKWVNIKVINKEEKEKEKYLWNIYTVLGNFLNKNINLKVSKDELLEKINSSLINDENIHTIKNTYLEAPDVILWELEGYIKNKGVWYNQILKIYENLEKNTGWWVMSERSYIIQLLEDFNTPLWAIFIEKVIKNISLEWKERWIEIKLNDKDILRIKQYIISNWNTLSWTLNHLACENSKNNVNTFITTNYVNTVYNLHKEIKKNTNNVFMITGRDVKTSKDKLKIINDFDKLDNFWKTLVATSKSVEKWLSIFNSLKWYTTIWDENAWALTQRIGRFRTLMDKQLNNLDTFKEKIEIWELIVKNNEVSSYLNNIKILKENKKEFFILSNKLSESMLQNSEVKNILLQKVNSTSMFNWIIDFNDDYFWNTWNSFSVNNVIVWVQKIIDNDKNKFFEKLLSYKKVINWDLLFLEINKNVKYNINKNTDSIKNIEWIKIKEKENTALNKFSIK